MLEPLSYEANLSIADARAKLTEVYAEFDRVRSKYGNLDEKVNVTIASEDKQDLISCFRVLLPLGLQPSVQQEVLDCGTRAGTVHLKISEVMEEIMLYQARFSNSGVRLLPINPFEI